MNCKNCHSPLQISKPYCARCGAKVVQERITLQYLWNDFIENYFGWDNKFVVTVVALILRPEVAIREFLDGTRNKYMRPLSFFALAAAVALFVFSTYSDRFIELSNKLGKSQTSFLTDFAEQKAKEKALKEGKSFDKEKYQKEQETFNTGVQKKMLENFNLYSFLLLPVYVLIAFWVFGKPYNYGEHLIIGAYIQGILFFVSCLFFLLSLLINPSFYYLTLVLSVVYYCFVYGRLLQLGLGRLLIKSLKAVGILVALFLLFMVGVVVFALVMKQYQKLSL